MAHIATDGAAVMTGCNEGVPTRLKTLVLSLISTHCSAHRLSLAACETANSSSSVTHFEKILNQIYTFFSKSAVQTAKLKEIQTVLNEPHLKLQRATDTRWLSHQNAVEALRKVLRPLHMLLEQEAADGVWIAQGNREA